MTNDRPAPTARAATAQDAGRVCPYCRFALKPGAEVIECGGCHAPHHADCWSDNGGCSMMGCVGGPEAADPAASPTEVLAPTTAVVPPPPPPPPAPSAPVAQTPVATPAAPPQRGGGSSRGGPALVAAVLVLALAVAGGAVALVVSSNKEDAPAASSDPTEQDVGDSASAATVDDSGTPSDFDDGDVLPADDEATMGLDIQEVLYDHHQAIVDGDYSTAWDLTSSRYQEKKLREDGYDAWQTAQETLTPYLDPSSLHVEIDELDRQTGVATIAVTGMGWSDPSSACSTWSGTTWAHYDSDSATWRYEPGYSMTPARRAEWEPRSDELLGWGC